MRYSTKYVEVEAMQWLGDNREELEAWAKTIKSDNSLSFVDPYLLINTLEGIMHASVGDWIICGTKGELYPCKPDIFSTKYRLVDNNMDRDFNLCTPRSWKNKESGKIFKVLPWFQPIDNDSRIDFKGLFKEVAPEMAGDIMKDFEVYSGLVMQVGWLLENEHGIWFGLTYDAKDSFIDLGQ